MTMARRAAARVATTLAALAAGGPAFAATGVDGASLGFAWALPFIGILLCIALGPLAFPHAWEHHQGKIAAFWGVAIVAPLALVAGPEATVEAVAHTALTEYMPFILLLLALFTTAGGILIAGNIHGSPAMNTALLAIGALFASLIGTTGASMVMIRPMLRANDDRRHNTHVFVFFIFLVSNLGGALTPLGDPPLFLGFLKGVDFFWTTRHLAAETLFACAVVLATFFVIDSWVYRHEKALPDPTPDKRVRVRGLGNLALIGVIIAAILLSAAWKPGVRFTVLGAELELQDLVRDAIFVVVTLVSLRITKPEYRAANGFSWGPIQEVARLFAAIFTVMIPVLAMLRAGRDGAFAPLVALVSNPDGSANNAAYFWLTGGLSSVLDNAPTYLVFFQLAGGDAQVLMREGALTLAAISCGAVFMGANTYIGNAPNFMVYAIARDGGVKMPSFIGYMAWSGAVLIPTFILTTLLFFR
ncbi:sodium:proton antiporter [Alsobacter sp. SYSU M60028]|uniref:Sodium:proton antiporter n=1 Tax=Alsobacter ponti TaxID=2962936 RepID=A0ABT1LBJ2_9HYPH|nr:sodium:proton antiporter [Alsobacter ponti]MCP8938860.1 sodium:proton antiporter [Alsobacter ponti]